MKFANYCVRSNKYLLRIYIYYFQEKGYKKICFQKIFYILKQNYYNKNFKSCVCVFQYLFFILFTLNKMRNELDMKKIFNLR